MNRLKSLLTNQLLWKISASAFQVGVRSGSRGNDLLCGFCYSWSCIYLPSFVSAVHLFATKYLVYHSNATGL